jgi:hypothetical protein
MITAEKPYIRRRQRALPQIEEKPLPTLEEALATVQARGVLCFADNAHGWDIWSPATKQALKPRQTLYKQRSTVRAMLHQALAVVCPSPRLHRWSWAKNADGVEICLLCAELAKFGAC